MEKTQAIEELIRCAGTQFDPGLVKDFIKVIKEKKELQMSGASSF